ncbi:hypothetical protein [Deinococcus cellulosilyticus]|uniref:Uncharacterized protein n=1 Tax=Deinococcus cellulosilyticus (strain DSM 18568 / NBRC 106333 / KACC 11606 / 5516J-15) TaxID=1223518 RepID=A0A511N3U3_DEIC1|nr:hypothetical protein [Deinococcus cellulosilyticus]GEM47138.1 hypothetical protein DC3_27730 [Deinococcus cellulosilyticus NBRC 106333 = KACC 11606]
MDRSVAEAAQKKQIREETARSLTKNQIANDCFHSEDKPLMRRTQSSHLMWFFEKQIQRTHRQKKHQISALAFNATEKPQVVTQKHKPEDP